jgi:hypothetical protein
MPISNARMAEMPLLLTAILGRSAGADFPVTGAGSRHQAYSLLVLVAPTLPCASSGSPFGRDWPDLLPHHSDRLYSEDGSVSDRCCVLVRTCDRRSVLVAVRCWQPVGRHECLVYPTGSTLQWEGRYGSVLLAFFGLWGILYEVIMDLWAGDHCRPVDNLMYLVQASRKVYVSISLLSGHLAGHRFDGAVGSFPLFYFC